MARYGVHSSDSSGEDDINGDTAELYCEAIKKLTPDIVPVLRNEIKSILDNAYSKGIVGEDVYTSGITLKENSHQASQLLVIVAAQIKVKHRFCHTFLKILRSMKATEHLADRIEEEVNHLQVKLKRGKKKHNNQGIADMPKLDLHEDGYSSGFYSEQNSTTVADDFGATPNQPRYDLGGDLDTLVGCQDIDVSTEITTTAQQDLGAPSLHLGSAEVGEETGEETAEQNRPFQPTEKIGSGVEESASYQRSDSINSKPVYPSKQGSISEGYDNIHRIVESEKRKAEDVIEEKNGTIYQLQQQLKHKLDEQYQERRKHEEEMKRKEEELLRSVADIEQKSEDIESLKRAHAQQIKELEDQHKEKMEQITRDLKMKSEKARQKMEELEYDLQRARNEKISLEKQKMEAEEEIKSLRSEHQKCLEEEKKKYQVEIEKLTLRYENEIHKLEDLVRKERSDAKQKEDYINMLHKFNLSELENKFKDETAALRERIANLKQEKTEADAQTKICEARMETQREKTEKERFQMQAQIDAKEAEIEVHRAKSETQLALKEQAEEHDREKREIVRTFLDARRSISSSPGGSNSITEEILSISLTQLSVTRTSSSQSEDSKNQTPSEDCEDPPFIDFNDENKNKQPD